MNRNSGNTIVKKLTLFWILALSPIIAHADAISVFSTMQYVGSYEELIQEENFKTLDAELQNLDLSHKRFDNGRHIFDHFLGVLGDEMAKKPDIYRSKLNKWVEISPDSYMPLLVRGVFYHGLAWDERGIGLSDAVAPEKWKLFHADIKRSREDFLEAFRRNPHSSTVPMELIGTERDAMNYSAAARWFKVAVENDPDNWVAYSQYMILLKPKWSGSKEALLDFARKEVSAHHDPIFGMLVLDAHETIADSDYVKGKSLESYYSQPEVWKDIDDALEKILAAYPNAIVDHNRLAYFAYFAGHYDIADREFKIIGDQRMGNIWPRQEDFDQARDRSARMHAGE